MARERMTRDEALDLAIDIYGMSACCQKCQIIRYGDDPAYKAACPSGPDTYLAFGRWLLAEGWQFLWEENDNNGGWTFEFRCPTCADAPAVP